MVASMALVTILISCQVVLRYVFNESLTWAEELTRFVIIWMSLIGAAMGVRCNAHISVALLASMSSERAQRLAIGGASVLGIVFALCMLWYGSELLLLAQSSGQVSSAMQVPMYAVYLIFPISGALMALRFGESGWRALIQGERLELPEQLD